MQSELDPALAGVIAALPAWSGRTVTATPIHAGITNKNFRVVVDAEVFVVRVPGKDTQLLGIDRETEHSMARAAAVAGVGPEVFAYLPETQTLITRFVEGKAVAEEELQQERVLTSVVEAVKRIHACPPISSAFPVFQIVDGYLKIAKSRGIRVAPSVNDLRERVRSVENALSHRPVPHRPCHNDLLNANLLQEGSRVWVVDYEYAGMGDPFFDLGNLSINNSFRPQSDERLLQLYFGNVTDSHRARLQLMRLVSDLREAAWGTIQQAISTLDYDYRAYADRHATRGLATAADARLPDWMAALM